MNMTFREELKNGDVEKLAAYPKADRHCHPIFGASLEAIMRWVGHPIKHSPSWMADFDAMRGYSHGEFYPVL